MKIPLQKAFHFLEFSSAVIVNNDVVLYPSLENLKDDESNEFLYFRWDDQGLEYTLKFLEGDNKDVEVIGSSMFLYDSESKNAEDYTQITILTIKNLEG